MTTTMNPRAVPGGGPSRWSEMRRHTYNLFVPLRNWWARAFGRGAAFDEGRDVALANAAMTAYDMGRPDIREAINRLIPVGSKYKPKDSEGDAYGG